MKLIKYSKYIATWKEKKNFYLLYVLEQLVIVQRNRYFNFCIKKYVYVLVFYSKNLLKLQGKIIMQPKIQAK